MDLNQESLRIHKEHNGKLATIPKAKLVDRHDLSVLYTPGVAAPCLEIKGNKDLSFEYTCRGNMVAVVTDGTRVLGDTSLLRCDDVHDDAALEHIRHAALDGEGAGAGSGLLCAQSWSSVREPSVVSTPEQDRRLHEKMLTLRMLLLGPRPARLARAASPEPPASAGSA